MEPKKPFFGIFSKFFRPRPPNHLMPRANLLSMKGLMEIDNRAKFYFHSVCSSQVKNFQKVSWRWSIHELGHFGRFLGPNSPKYCPILMKLAPEVVFKERNRVFQKILTNSNFQRNCTLSKFNFFFSVFAQLWGSIRISQNRVPIWSQFFRKNTITFCSILAFLCRKMGVVER